MTSAIGGLVGRADDLGKLADAARAARLVTIVGAPGIGKTRLVLEHVADDANALFCDLSDVTSEDEMLAVVGRVLGVEAGNAALGDAIARALASRGESVLVLDNLEQILHAARALVTTLVVAAPRARFLATSRQRLELAGERVVLLGPLAAPDAIELLVQRAKALAPDFTIAASEIDEFTKLVTELDGLPLALELAASKVRVFGPSALRERLRARFAILTRAPGASRSQGASLFGAIETSWSALAPHEQTALVQCTVFRGGFDLDAAERVLDLGRDAPPVTEVLESLHDRSLLGFERAVTTTSTTKLAPRFALLASVRDFARATTTPEALRAIEERHAEHYLATKLPRVEHENLLAALTYARDPNRVLRIAVLLALESPWRPYRWREAILRDAMDRSQEKTSATYAAALEARGNVLRFTGDLDASLADFEALAKIASAKSTRSDRLQAIASAGIANGLAARTKWKDARKYYRVALAAYGRAGDETQVARVNAMMAATYFNTDDPRGAGDLLERALAKHRAVRDRTGVAIASTSLGAVAVCLGEHGRAQSLLEEGITLTRALGNRHWEGVAQTYLALLTQDQKDLARARTIYDASLARLEEVGVRRAIAVALGHDASARVELGDLDAAEDEARRAIEIHHETSPDHVGVVTALLGAIAALRGDNARAANFFASAASLLASRDRPAFRAVLDVYRGMIGEAVTEEARGAIAALSPTSAELRAALRIAGATSASLVVAKDSAWFVAPGGKEVRLHRRPPLKRVLAALVAARSERPGIAMSVEALVRAGWPGERVLAQAGAERVYAAVAELRRLGLRNVLLRKDDGYLLDPEIRVETR